MRERRDRTERRDRNAPIIEEFHANEGKVGGPFEGKPMLILHVKGRRTGRERTIPLVYLADGDRFVIIASKGGAPKDPHWFHNLVADPNVEIEVGTRTIPVTAKVITGPERDALYARQAEIMPAFADYEAKAGRTIPVIALEPVS